MPWTLEADLDEFFKWIETSWFNGKSASVTAAEYTLKRADGLKALTTYTMGALKSTTCCRKRYKNQYFSEKNWLFLVKLGRIAGERHLFNSDKRPPKAMDLISMNISKSCSLIYRTWTYIKATMCWSSTCLGRKISKRHVATNKEIAWYSRKNLMVYGYS